MRSTLLKAFAIGVFAVGAATTANAQQSAPAAQGVDVGKYEYDGHCAACHGSTGKGDGHFVVLLKSDTGLLNLTQLSKKNNGVFPFARVYETIDGRQQVQAHGTRDMPVWGRELSAKAIIGRPYYDDEAFVRARILALTEYIYRLQSK